MSYKPDHPAPEGKTMADKVDVLAVTPKQIAHYLRSVEGMGCNCDLDNWQPTAQTGHSHVCRIHKTATARPGDMRPGLLADVSAALARIGGAA